MPVERVVVNASPLIILFKAHLESLLPQLFSDIHIPEAVWTEITDFDYVDEPISGIKNAEWARQVDVSDILPNIAIWDLGAGESEVLSFAFQHYGVYAVIDDKAARRCAKTLGIKTLGTGGILILAKRRGIIESVTSRLDKLRQSGLWITDELADLLLKEAGEK